MTKKLVTEEEPVNLEVLSLSVTEMAVPPYVLWLAAQSVVMSGHVLRADIVDQLHRASAVAFSPLATESSDLIKRTAQRTEQASQRVLHKLSPDNSLHAFYAACMFCLRLVDEGLLADPQSMAVLTAMVVMDDLKAEGSMDDYRFRENVLRMAADTMIDAARREGLYLGGKPVPRMH